MLCDFSESRTAVCHVTQEISIIRPRETNKIEDVNDFLKRDIQSVYVHVCSFTAWVVETTAGGETVLTGCMDIHVSALDRHVL